MSNADKAVPVVQINLDKPRNMKFNLRAMMEFEKATGKNVFKEDIWEDMSATDIVYLLWATLKHEDENLTVDDVAEMVHFGNMEEITEKLTKAFGMSLPDAGRSGDEKNVNTTPTG